MGIIATVGRRSIGVMTLIISMYLLLIVGGISMVYPFLLMLSTATTTMSDMQEYRVIPAYWYDDNALYRKYLWLRYDTGRPADGPRHYNLAYFPQDANVSSFRLDEDFGWGFIDRDKQTDARGMPNIVSPDDPDLRRRAADLDRFLTEAPTLWPGPPLMITGDAGQRTLVTDPYGQPLDPHGLSTGLGNRYRIVGYIGAVYGGLHGIGREQWTDFIHQFYTDPDHPSESEGNKLGRVIDRHGRPYEHFRQVFPGYDMPDSPSWSMVEGEYQQMDWLFYKAVWTSGAPIIESPSADARRNVALRGPQDDPESRRGVDLRVGITPHVARVIGEDADTARGYTDVLGRTHQWTRARALSALRPTQLLPEFWRQLRNRYMKIEHLNLEMGLARRDWANEAEGKMKIVPRTRRVALAETITLPDGDGGHQQVPEPRWLASLRASLGLAHRRPASTPDHDGDPAYQLPPAIDRNWAKLTYIVGLSRDRIIRRNEREEDAWVDRMASAGYPTAELKPFNAFHEIYLSPREPVYPPMAHEWRQFVSQNFPAEMIDWAGRDPTAQPPDAGARTRAATGVEEKLKMDFSRRHLRAPIHAWRDFLRYRYAGRADEFRRLYLPGLDEAAIARRVADGRMFYGGEFDEYSLARMPIMERDLLEFAARKSELRWTFLTGNFNVVLDDLVLEGRAMFNTIVLIFLAIGTHVTVNPFAAYALSRFRLRYTYKVLLFMLATMAFPPAVGMIPGFLLLRNFGLINTYAALVLPSIASGYTIFLLKGFFDALPQELYEAAEIDGAGKVTTFVNVTFPLSKPIFAIITLQSFTAAYSGFMWAFLICPDQKMWTVMVHLFNIQQWNTLPIGMAALVIAAIPTFLVFLFCQNVILRGIIIPSFK